MSVTYYLPGEREVSPKYLKAGLMRARRYTVKVFQASLTLRLRSLALAGRKDAGIVQLTADDVKTWTQHIMDNCVLTIDMASVFGNKCRFIEVYVWLWAVLKSILNLFFVLKFFN